MPKVGWVKTTGFLTVVIDGVPKVIQSTSPLYKRALSLVNKNDKKGLIKYFTCDVEEYTKGKMTLENNTIKDNNGVELPIVLAQKVVEFSKNRLPFTPLKKFLENLSKNPNGESRDQLLKYLEHNHFPITSDGCFLAYKYVRKTDKGLVDAHTGTYKNNVGCIVAMDRNKCNSDREQTCSSGLHVAAYTYASSCGDGQVILEVKVNPKDVVAVPSDYNNQKMRVCRYEVVKAGAEEVKSSYMGSRKFSDKNAPKEVVSHDKIELSGMSAREIIDLVYKQTGEKIKLSPKSKKAVLKRAQSLLNGQGLKTTQKVIILNGLSASQIMKEVKKITGEKTKLSPKSKKSVLKWAIKALEDHNFMFTL